MSNFLDFSIQTRKEFKNWIFRQLGYPIIQPEIRDENLDDCINDALEEYTEYASQDQKFFAINLRDYIGGKGYYMPGDVAAITNVWDYGVHNSTSNGINPFSFSFMMVNGGFVPSPFTGRYARSGWFDYHLAMSWLDLTYQMTCKGFEWDYNPRTKLLILNPDPISYFNLTPGTDQNDSEGCWIVCECMCLRPDEQNYGEVWVKKMALAKAKIYIGTIRTTYTGINLVGGAQINGTEILQQGTTEQEALRTELRARFPVIGMWHG